MPLNWNIEKVENWKEISTGAEAHKTETLVWMTMPVGLNQITKDNWYHFYVRLHLLEKIEGPFLHIADKPYYFTEEDIKRRIGFYTNASNKTKSQFTKFAMERFYQIMDEKGNGVLTA